MPGQDQLLPFYQKVRTGFFQGQCSSVCYGNIRMPVWGWRDGVVVESTVPGIRFPASAWWLASVYNSSSGDLKPSSGASHPCSHKENFKSFMFRNRVCLCPGWTRTGVLSDPASECQHCRHPGLHRTLCSNLVVCHSSLWTEEGSPSLCFLLSSHNHLIQPLPTGRALLLRARGTNYRTQKPFCNGHCWSPVTCSTQGPRQLGGPPSNTPAIVMPLHTSFPLAS